MANKPAGIKEAYLASGGAIFPADGVGARGLGYRDKGTLAISHFNELKDKDGRVFPNMLNFKADLSTMQLSKALLKDLITYAQASDVTAKIVTAGVVKNTNFTSTGGIFTFENDKSMGIDWEINITPKERLAKIILEAAYKDSVGRGIITASKTDTLPGSLNIPALDRTNVLKGFINPSFGNVSIGDERLADFKINLKTKSSKGGFNRSLVSGIEVSIEGAMSGADPDEILAFLLHEFCGDITIAVPTDTPYNIILKADGLTKFGAAEIGDDKRESKVMLAGTYDIDFADASGDDIILQAKL